MWQLPKFYHYPPETTGSGSAGPVEMGHEEIIEFLNDDDDDDKKDIIPLKDEDKIKDKKIKDEEKETLEKKKETIKENKEEDETDDEDEEDDNDDELKEIEEELEPPTDEQLELVTPVRRKEILKKYPTLFKDFPYLEKAYYREQQFTELLPTIDDAKQAVEAKGILDGFERDLVNGNTETILKAVKIENPKAFYKLVDNYMTNLSKVDTDAYHHVIGNVIKHTIMQMVSEGRASKNDALQTAAQILNQFTFGSSNFKPPENLSKESEVDNTKDIELQKKEQAFVRRQFESSRNDLNTRVNNSLKNTIDANLDPKQSMTDYVRRTASREALENLEKLIDRDTRFKSLVDKLWERAFQSNFSKDSLDKIRSAYHSKAKTLLPSVIKKARNEALRGLGKRVKDDTDEDNDTIKADKKGPIKNESPRSTSRSGKITKAEDIPQGMSTLDFLNSD